MLTFFKYIFFVVFLLVPAAAGAQGEVGTERITFFKSDIEVFQDASMVVKETIQVVSAGEQIKHGIYRDFPLAYRDRLGKRYVVGFTILEVTRDGHAEPYHTQRSGNGERIYIGSEDVLVPPGEHTYTLRYRTDRQLGFFADHDELYWNVTGNGWVFPIEKAEARVKLPGNVSKDNITTALYTGAQGSNAQAGTARVADTSTVEFATTQPLGSYEGLTIVVGWPKGVVEAPTQAQTAWAAIMGNLDYIVGVLGFIIVLAFYIFLWRKRGRDPQKGTVIAQYEPPHTFSPALIRYIRRMGSDNRTFAAAIISMAVKGHLTITEHKGFFGKKTYTLTKKEGASLALSPEENTLKDQLFADGNEFELKKANAQELVKVREKFTDSLKEQVGKKYFSRNTFAVVLGVLMSIAVIAGTIATAANVRFSIGSPLEVLFWPALLVALLVVNIVFGLLMRAYTPEGRKLVDEIEGFKLFLKVTEQDRLAFHNPPNQTPELFEKMLPFALALGVEHQWAEQFAGVFAKLKDQNTNYMPVWYVGSLTHFSPDSFASEIGNSFTGVVAAASTPPGSSSGFSGGSSGGGGGGGGGGGW